MLLMVNSQTNDMDRVYNRFQQKNTKLQNQVQNLTRELRRRVAAMTYSVWIPVPTATPVPTVADARVSAAAAEWQTHRQ